jgi:hypothetical protein
MVKMGRGHNVWKVPKILRGSSFSAGNSGNQDKSWSEGENFPLPSDANYAKVRTSKLTFVV